MNHVTKLYLTMIDHLYRDLIIRWNILNRKGGLKGELGKIKTRHHQL